MKLPLRTSVVIGTLCVALTGVGAGAAWADPLQPVSDQATAQHQANNKVAPNVGKLHPQSVPAPQGGSMTVLGTVVRANAGALTVRGADGRTRTVTLTSRIVITKQGRPANAAALLAGDRVQMELTAGGGAPVATKIDDAGH